MQKRTVVEVPVPASQTDSRAGDAVTVVTVPDPAYTRC